MAEGMPKRKIKDSVFTDLFKDKKYLLQLYRTLHPEDLNTTEDDIADITLKHVLVDTEYNDLGFSVGNRLMILMESQSTWSINIIIRALMYMVQTYHDYFKRNDQNLYGSKRVALPEPELYMIFTGDRKNIPEKISLSKEFFGGKKIAVDVEVKILYRESEEDIIGQYIIFCKVYNEQRKLYGNTKQAITETIRICKDRYVLKDYLESRETEVVDIMMTLFDDDYILEAYVKDYAKDYAKEVARETSRKKAILMLKKGKITIEEVQIFFPEFTEQEIKEIELEAMQSA